jgi:hypothetical protein
MSDCMEKHCSQEKFETFLVQHGLPLPVKEGPWYQKYIQWLLKETYCDYLYHIDVEMGRKGITVMKRWILLLYM